MKPCMPNFFQVYSVGVGLNSNRIKNPENLDRAAEELQLIAKPSDNVFNVLEFDRLSGFLSQVVRIACPRLCSAL